VTSVTEPLYRTRAWGGTIVHVRHIDPVAAVAALLAAVMAVAYVALMAEQSDQPAMWFLGLLIMATALSGYGADRNAAHRRTALVSAAVVLAALGVLGILSIGLPILIAGLLCGVAAARADRIPAPGS
jgi:hypothetical protein